MRTKFNFSSVRFTLTLSSESKAYKYPILKNLHLLTDLFQIQLQEATAMTAHLSVVAQQPAQGNSCLNYCFPP